MKDLKNILLESILDIDSIDKKLDNDIYLDALESILNKHSNKHYKDCIDMFGREIKVGDICFAYVMSEFHFIKVKEIIYDGGYACIIPTVDYKYIDGDGFIDPYCCILIPEKYHSNFLKMIKSK